MTIESFHDLFEDWQQRAASLNHQLAPIVNVKIDINAPDWEDQILSKTHPSDSAGLRVEVISLFNEILDRFEVFDTGERQQIIDMMYNNDALMYSAVMDADCTTPEGFRRRMIFFVIDDQGKDTRDAIMALAKYRADAEALGIYVVAIFNEMADISSRRDKFGWGSTRDLFLNYHGIRP